MKNETLKNCCPMAHECSFYQRSHSYMPTISERLREEYCLEDFTHCACRRVHDTVGSEWVPLHMLPYQQEWAEQILDELIHEPLQAVLQMA